MVQWRGEGGAPPNARLNGENDIALKEVELAKNNPPLIRDIQTTEVHGNAEQNVQQTRTGRVSKRIVKIARNYNRNIQDATGALGNFFNNLEY